MRELARNILAVTRGLSFEGILLLVAGILLKLGIRSVIIVIGKKTI
jgi:hypothetical protein